MAKKTKLKLPKQVAGVKIPKKLRKKGGKLLAVLDTPAGRELAVAGLMAAAAAIAKRKQAAAATPAPDAPATPEAETDARDAPSHDPRAAGAQFASAAAGVAAAALDRWLKAKRTGHEAPPEPPIAPEAPPPGSTAH